MIEFKTKGKWTWVPLGSVGFEGSSCGQFLDESFLCFMIFSASHLPLIPYDSITAGDMGP